MNNIKIIFEIANIVAPMVNRIQEQKQIREQQKHERTMGIIGGTIAIIMAIIRIFAQVSKNKESQNIERRW